MHFKRLSLAVFTAFFSVLGLTAFADDPVNLISNGTFAPKEGETIAQAYYAAKVNINFSDKFTSANPFQTLADNYWYGYRFSNNTASYPMTWQDYGIGVVATTHTSDSSGKGYYGKQGVLCVQFTVPEGQGGFYNLNYYAHAKQGVSTWAQRSKMTTYMFTTAEAGVKSMYPNGTTANVLAMKKNNWKNIIMQECNNNGSLVYSFGIESTAWRPYNSFVWLEPGEYTLIWMNVYHDAETSWSDSSYYGVYLDDVSLTKAESDVGLEIQSDSTKVTYVASIDGHDLGDATTAPANSFVKVTATPQSGFIYPPVHAGWTMNTDGSMYKYVKMTQASNMIVVPDPHVDVCVPASFDYDADKVSYTATSPMGTVGATILSNVTVTVTATAAAGYDYLETPAGWVYVGNQTITKNILVNVDPFNVTIPTPVATVVCRDKGWTKTLENGDVVVAFTNVTTHTFTVPAGVISIDYLVVAGGGGGGGGRISGGGGAGGMLMSTTPQAVTAGETLTIVVGKGGPGGQRNGTKNQCFAGGNGDNSSLSGAGITEAITAVGGGGGACNTAPTPVYAGKTGGSGGGAVGGNTTAACVGGEGTAGQGNAGGGPGAVVSQSGASGGGGAGGVGGTGAGGYVAGKGGAGLPCSITGEEVYYAAGGGGGNNGTGGAGGQGGGGQGGTQNETTAGGNATLSTGSGGGGAGYAYVAGGNGADGIVVIRYGFKSQLAISCDTTKATCVAVCDEQPVVDGDYVSYNSEVDVVVTARKGYEYTDDVVPAEWTKNQDGTISRTYIADSPTMTIEVPDPKQTGAAEELVSVIFEEAEFATYEASIGEIPLTVDQVVSNSVIDVVVTAAEHYKYAELPKGWSWGEEGKVIRISVTASTDPTMIVIPEATPIMIEVVVDNSLGENVVYTITTNGVVIAQPAYVLEGTEVTITVTPQGNYEYSKAPEGWEKIDGTITRVYTVDEDFKSVVVPTENFRKQRITVKVSSKGVTYALTNAVTGAEIVNNTSVEVDQSVAVTATLRTSYAFPDGYEVPAGWTLNGKVLTGTFPALTGTIQIPQPTFSPARGENLVENGDFEDMDTAKHTNGCTERLGDLNAGTWNGECTNWGHWGNYGAWMDGDYIVGYYAINTHVKIRKGSGLRAANLTASTASNAAKCWCTVTLPRTGSYKFSYWGAHNNVSKKPDQFTVELMTSDGKTVVTTLDSHNFQTDGNGVWAYRACTNQLEKGTYRIRFRQDSTDGTSTCFDDVSLIDISPKGTVILIK